MVRGKRGWIWRRDQKESTRNQLQLFRLSPRFLYRLLGSILFSSLIVSTFSISFCSGRYPLLTPSPCQALTFPCLYKIYAYIKANISPYQLLNLHSQVFSKTRVGWWRHPLAILQADKLKTVLKKWITNARLDNRPILLAIAGKVILWIVTGLEPRGQLSTSWKRYRWKKLIEKGENNQE
jgi:hypothetical protein